MGRWRLADCAGWCAGHRVGTDHFSISTESFPTGDADSIAAYLDRGADVLRDSRMEVMGLLEFHAGCSVLDVGCGTGKFLIEVARNVEGVHAVGIDFSESMVKTATSRASETGVAVKFATGDAQQLDFREGSFDRVNCERF